MGVLYSRRDTKWWRDGRGRRNRWTDCAFVNRLAEERDRVSDPLGICTMLHPVFDLAKAKAVYTALFGLEPATEAGD
jgi:hypothetical protein